ncbi:MAG: hypothetical protein COA75_14080 [Cellvibrionales bacterium]|nr:MAG: hypothetical protein COA75_14080 [Cellvibrionales bacterium]
MYNKQASGQQGFTLVELLIVIAIIAIVASIAVPSMTSFVNKNRVKRAAEEVYGLVTKARAEGVIRDKNMSVALTVVDEDEWCLGYADVVGCDCTEGDLTVADACDVFVGDTRVQQVITSSGFDGVAMIGNNVTFNFVKGTASTGNVTLTSGDWSLKILVSGVGRVRICGPNANLMGYPAC